MQKIIGKEKCLSDLLINKKYTIHYYQREYRWGQKQIKELLEDLTDEFLEKYDENHSRDLVEGYGHYYLGSIVLSSGDNQNAIIDGQQRLTSLTLLLIFLNNLQNNRPDRVPIDDLIFSDRHGRKTFNISVSERDACLEALYTRKEFSPDNLNESVRTIYDRYKDIEAIFPEELKGKALPYFIGWLIYNVDLVEISAYTEQDAHKIFVSMNDRGLNLTPTEMLKGFVLSEIISDQVRNRANDLWKAEIIKLNSIDKEEDTNFFKSWLRAQYAESIRETKKGATNEDFDIIGTTFHKWVRENAVKIGLSGSSDYEKFVIDWLPKYSKIYQLLKSYSIKYNPDFEYVFYNHDRNFTFQYQVILATISPDDNESVISSKIKITSKYIDQFIARRVFNFKTVDYSTVKNTMFSLSKKIRRKSIDELVVIFNNELESLEFKLNNIDKFYLNQFTRRYMLHILARMTYFVESNSRLNTKFEDYTAREIKNPFDIEHLWADKYERFADQFENEDEFQIARNKFGALILLPQDKNRSFQDNTFEEKLPIYFGENLLAKSLNENCYSNNPHFLSFNEGRAIGLKAYSHFNKESIAERQAVYSNLCKLIWGSPITI